MKYSVVIGLILCLLGLFLLNANVVIIGLPSFLFGIYLMNRDRWKK